MKFASLRQAATPEFASHPPGGSVARLCSGSGAGRSPRPDDRLPLRSGSGSGCGVWRSERAML